MASEKNEKQNFEQALARLEAIVAEMEGGKLPLAESMKRFEEGMRLSAYCSEKLGEAEKKVETLFQKANGEMEWRETEVPEEESE
ncbi:MAG: exodeoxyribonuclease VII small subunit [Lentisphaeria bacterium]|nr:exodeoxyribonuclease VII small subunit [Lentisphaeria bacterium]